jgi:hypothetical protein
MKWDGMKWNGMEWNGSIPFHAIPEPNTSRWLLKVGIVSAGLLKISVSSIVIADKLSLCLKAEKTKGEWNPLQEKGSVDIPE